MAKVKIAVPVEEHEAFANAVMTQCCEFTMEKWFLLNKRLGLTEAKSKEEFYGFRSTDIVEVHCRLIGICEVLYFRVRDGRVIDCMAREHDTASGRDDLIIH